MSELKSMVEAIIDTLQTAYGEAEEAMGHLGDEDPCASDVSNIICNGYEQAEYCRESIGSAIYDLEALNLEDDEDEDKEPEPPKKGICYTCGNRS